MSSLVYTTSDSRTHNVSHSNFVVPSNNLSDNSKTHLIIPFTYGQEQQKKKTSAEARCVRESVRPKRKRSRVEVGPPPSDRNAKNEFLQPYGNHMFLDLEKELSFERDNYGRGLCADVFAAVDHDLSDDVLSFSSRDELLLDQYFSAKSP